MLRTKCNHVKLFLFLFLYKPKQTTKVDFISRRYGLHDLIQIIVSTGQKREINTQNHRSHVVFIGSQYLFIY
jgi:hypothetical protein